MSPRGAFAAGALAAVLLVAMAEHGCAPINAEGGRFWFGVANPPLSGTLWRGDAQTGAVSSCNWRGDQGPPQCSPWAGSPPASGG